MSPVTVLARRTATTVALAAAAALVGCAQPAKPPLYVWGAYQGQVYEHLRAEGGNPLDQYAVLSAQLQQTVSSGGRVPPGLHAHLGLLQLKLGKPDEAFAHFESEKKLFPESAAYVDWLMKRSKTGGK
ncbi:MAG: DUF4810 domain-containing protein [Burkholderiales bacterium PBB6]|nr:MAG: DUF4810 domain-containing protein [Burkholderiales bacterium PBB6]